MVLHSASLSLLASRAERRQYVPAELPRPEALDSSPSACNQVLQSPRVALMFLTRGDLFHKDTWRLWFESAIGTLPRSALRAGTCGPDWGLDRLQTVAKDGNVPANITTEMLIDAQYLFSVYVHAPPGVEASDVAPLFRRHMIQRRVVASWGTHKLVEAARNLLLEAYTDPLNARFLLISESDIPLYDPLTLYTQLMSEQASRVNGCANRNTDRRRWSWRMRTERLRAHHWRKSSQWFMLTREHAKMVLEDEEIYRKFEQYCVEGYDKDYRRNRDCYSDEHYIPTLFAVNGVQIDSNCGAIGAAATVWEGGPHPRAFEDSEINPWLIEQRLRKSGKSCDASRAYEEAQNMFVSTVTGLTE